MREILALPGKHEPGTSGLPSAREALDRSIRWLLLSQEAMSDGGMGSFHLTDGWSASYPETTGYIIPTLLEYARRTGNVNAKEGALRAAAFLLEVQRPGGGWQGGRIGENAPEIVFNTGQAVRGMLKAFEETNKQPFLDAAVKACDWLCTVQDAGGFWKKNALMDKARVYDAFVDVPLMMMADVTGVDKYRESARRNLDWIISRKKHENGWFEDCDNTEKKNHKPILHTIAYTLDGLLDASQISGDASYFEAAITGSEILRGQFTRDGILRGRYDKQWRGSEHFICTGGAQMAIVWMKIWKINGQQEFRHAARDMMRLLMAIQQRHDKGLPDTRGALPGSSPIWGRYEPFSFPNWATKFFCDALLMIEDQER